MGCSSCGTKSGGSCSPAGCKSNGTCGTDGCNALNVFDWFKDMDLPDGQKPFDIVEVRFKGSRKEFFRNSQLIDLFTGDYVVVESSVGFDVGTVSATGEIVRLQLKKYRVREDDEEMRVVQRVATDRDMERYHEAKAKEDEMLERGRTIAFGLNLSMKISDIELQGDGRKVIFFYTAETRVDFRELIKKYAEEFRVKIEMRHISYREEASRLGGIGVCGRELCCSSWLTDYKQVNTGAARTQNLSINMEKLAGQCGRLKCCLNYELDTYLEAIESFPKAKIVKIDTVSGPAYARKTDILKRLMWFAYDETQNWIPLHVDTVNELMEKNRNGEQAPPLSDMAAATAVLEKVIEDENNDFIDNSELMKDNEFKDLDKNRNNRNKRKNTQNRDRRGPRPEGNNTENRGSSDNRNRDNNRPRGPRPEGGSTENRGPSDNRNRENNRERGPRPEGGNTENRRSNDNRNRERGPRPEGASNERRRPNNNRNRNRNNNNRDKGTPPNPSGPGPEA
jgi:cell fate regulator YaaT (PSP1 superfamily)